MAGLERLKRRPDFLRVAGAKRKWVAPGLILQARRRDPAAMTHDETTQGAKGAGAGGATARDGATRGHPASACQAPARVGFTVSRKVGNAVARNRARRRLRAAADAVMPRHAAPGHDYVLIGRAGTLTRPFAGLVADLEAGLKHLGTYRAGTATGPASTGPRLNEAGLNGAAPDSAEPDGTEETMQP